MVRLDRISTELLHIQKSRYICVWAHIVTPVIEKDKLVTILNIFEKSTFQIKFTSISKSNDITVESSEFF